MTEYELTEEMNVTPEGELITIYSVTMSWDSLWDYTPMPPPTHETEL